ncbi:hypothetical protein V5799_019455 [Amblyomma americanum]|uniref:EMI domain-containing protein n=1 Tax=Amblyomma americanum TaxID=6943 RepID=A0AAQ4EX67_AMBAM
MRLVWVVVPYLQVLAVVGVVLGLSDIPLRPTMPNVCPYRKSETVRVTRPCRRAFTTMVKVRTFSCSRGWQECFRLEPR